MKIKQIRCHWETLIENLKFISTIKTIDFFRISYVVQNDNYTEMEQL